jgi:hypothetical protein
VIKKWIDFISEEVSGTELVGPIGPAYGETNIRNKTISTSHTTVIEGMDGKLYTEDMWNSLYNDYLKIGGSPLNGFNKENIDLVLYFLQGK